MIACRPHPSLCFILSARNRYTSRVPPCWVSIILRSVAHCKPKIATPPARQLGGLVLHLESHKTTDLSRVRFQNCWTSHAVSRKQASRVILTKKQNPNWPQMLQNAIKVARGWWDTPHHPPKAVCVGRVLPSPPRTPLLAYID
jgi:hypothetical protein